MLTMYPACIYKDNSGYSAVFPDLNYLATCGETLEECINMAIDCLAGYAFFIEKEGETLSAGRIYDKIGKKAKAKVLVVLPDGAICKIKKKSLK